jgi:hypothetical protein
MATQTPEKANGAASNETDQEQDDSGHRIALSGSRAASAAA